MKPTLFDISRELLALDQLLDEIGGEITSPEAEQAIDKLFAELGDARDEKIDNYAVYIAELEARTEARREQAARMTELAEADANRAAHLRKRLHQFFLLHNITKLDTARFKFVVANNGGKLPLDVRVAPEELPAPYRREKVVVSADQDAIRLALEAGEPLEFAALGVRGTHLRIR